MFSVLCVIMLTGGRGGFCPVLVFLWDNGVHPTLVMPVGALTRCSLVGVTLPFLTHPTRLGQTQRGKDMEGRSALPCSVNGRLSCLKT